MSRRPPTRPPEPPPPPEEEGESREEKFKRIAPRRVNHLLHETKVLGNLANRASYSYTEEQVDRMFEVIQASIDDTKALFKRGRRPEFHRASAVTVFHTDWSSGRRRRSWTAIR